MIEAKIIADSVSSVNGERITTFELVYPRYIHAELLVHRLFSRNAASSRAIPIKEMIRLATEERVYPIEWRANQGGMQAAGPLEPTIATSCKYIWDKMADAVCEGVEKLSALGLHKQWANRPLEPFQHIKTIVTFTESDNFFHLRCHCYSDDTEVLTTTGWKLIKDVQLNEEVVSLNTKTRKLENASVVNTVAWKSEGEAIKFEGAGLDLLVSNLHQMVVLEDSKLSFKLAKDLINENPTMVKNCVVDDFDEQSIQYKQGKFLGFYLGNGWKYKSEISGNSGIVVCKGDTHGHNVIADMYVLATELFIGKNIKVSQRDGVYLCTVDGKSVYEQFKDYGNAVEKDIPEWVWESTQSLKRGVFDGMLLADSNILQRSGGLKYYTSSKKMADSFQRLCLEVGVSGTVAVDNRVGGISEGIDSQGNRYKIETKNIGYRISVNLHRNTPKLKKCPESVEYDGDFVCLSLDKNHTLYVRRNGKAVWSGNCDAQPEIKMLAELMHQVMEESEPERLDPGQWHTPYVNHYMDSIGTLYYGYHTGDIDDLNSEYKVFNYSLEEALKISASCCAQVSYRKNDDSLDKALKIYDRLVSSEVIHSSPLEHCATPMQYPTQSLMSDAYLAEEFEEEEGEESWWPKGITHCDRQGNLWSGNFKGYIQYRQLIPNNACWNWAHKYNKE